VKTRAFIGRKSGVRSGRKSGRHFEHAAVLSMRARRAEGSSSSRK
jgi:hypothetical protein